mmetsp:Transcript_1975/g.8715  ORF Transcript_1975/g.8715 Transcript_1975/m.8715 type:complete len:210 (+) Transcript_1975:150-779(+)
MLREVSLALVGRWAILRLLVAFPRLLLRVHSPPLPAIAFPSFTISLPLVGTSTHQILFEKVRDRHQLRSPLLPEIAPAKLYRNGAFPTRFLKILHTGPFRAPRPIVGLHGRPALQAFCDHDRLLSVEVVGLKQLQGRSRFAGDLSVRRILLQPGDKRVGRRVSFEQNAATTLLPSAAITLLPFAAKDHFPMNPSRQFVQRRLRQGSSHD